MISDKYTPLFSAKTSLDFNYLNTVIEQEMAKDTRGEGWSLIDEGSEGREAEMLYRLDVGKQPGLELLFRFTREPSGLRLQVGYGGNTKGSFNKSWNIVRRRSDAIELDIMAADSSATIGH
jgi:hypothetical protein